MSFPTTQYGTCQWSALQLLEFLGVTSLAPQPAAALLDSIQPNDLFSVIGALNAAMQECADLAPGEVQEFPGGAWLQPPTQVTVSATFGSTAITFPGFLPWMIGCTIRIPNDGQDNELINGTTLAAPYAGTTGANITATVFGDCVQLPNTVRNVVHPVSIPNQIPLIPAGNRYELLQWAGSPLITDAQGLPMGLPFFYYFKKTVSRPIAWFCEGFNQNASGLNYIPKRIRLAPMPDQAYPLQFRCNNNPPIFAVSDIDNGDHVTDPGTVFPITNNDLTGILMPIAKWYWMAHPRFKNEAVKPLIQTQYERAKAQLQNSRTQVSLTRIRYF